MRFKSAKQDGYRVYAVSGVNTISFGIEATPEARRGLLGFAVERTDPTEDERYFMPGFKVFPSVIPQPLADLAVSTWEHPVQSFVWDDFTAKPDRLYEYAFYPIRGRPKYLDRTASPVRIRVRTERLYGGTHDVFFNRGVASSQAYRRKFGNRRLDDMPPSERAEALQWLTRDLDEAIVAFIQAAQPGDSLLGCFYEFRYEPVVREIKAAIDRGVVVRLIVDAKVNEYTDKHGTFHPSFPREENLETLNRAGIPEDAIVLREARPNDIQHNKFLVLIRANDGPAEVWTGSTNLSLGGFAGQTNVGHWVRDPAVAAHFVDYWELLRQDPGAPAGATRSEASRANRDQHVAVANLLPTPTEIDEIPAGVTPIFSPRAGDQVLQLYARMVDSAESCACITLAFGVNRGFKERLSDNTEADHVVFLLLEREDRPNPRASTPFVRLDASNNVYQAWGSYFKDPLYQWARETNARALGINKHVAYIHSKFLLMDPLGPDPIVVTGSANFSTASTNSNDENMLLIRGEQQVADIYFTEFNRLFNHYYFRSVRERSSGAETNLPGASLFLDEDDRWLKKYTLGKLRTKRLAIFTRMAGTQTL